MPKALQTQLLRVTYYLVMVLALPNLARSQDQAIYFDGTNQYAAFDAFSSRPFSSPAGTIQLWIKVDRPGVLLQRAQPQTAPVLDFTAAQCANIPLRVLLDTRSAGNDLVFSVEFEQRSERLPKLLLADEQWHFLAITYDRPLLTVYLDGEKTSQTRIDGLEGQKLTRRPGRCHVGGSPRERSSFRGAIDNLTLWQTARTEAQVRTDMTGFPRLEATTSGLVATFDFSEGQGTSFRDRARRVVGSHPSARWTTPIASNPTLLSQGIWFVIQNKAEVADDTAFLARRVALRSNGPQAPPSMASLPATGTVNEFLWRVEPTGDRFRLHNKHLGDEFALTLFQGKAVMMPTNQNRDSQKWAIREWDRRRGGLNTFVLTSSLPAPASAAATQAWVFQPMYPLGSYHIGLPDLPDPSAMPLIGPPYTKVLELPHGFLLRATNTVSDWAILNAHNIYSNMFAAITYQGATGDEGPTEKRSVTMISRYDDKPSVSGQYPDFRVRDHRWLEVHNWGFGGSEGEPRTLITEEFFCSLYKGVAYSEFDQAVHEFSHTLDSGIFRPAGISKPDRGTRWAGDNKIEWFPNRVTQWFNTRHATLKDDAVAVYGTPGSVMRKYTRENLGCAEKKEDQGADKSFGDAAGKAGERRYFATFFADGEDYWTPPRCLSRVPGNPGTSGADPRNVTPRDGWYKLKTALQRDGKCLESNQVAAPPSSLLASTTTGAVFKGASFMDNCQNVSGQAWKFVPEGSSGFFRLKSRLHGDGKCLEVNTPGPRGVLGGAAFMADCGNVPGQLWKLVPRTVPSSRVSGNGSTGCSDVLGIPDATRGDYYALSNKSQMQLGVIRVGAGGNLELAADKCLEGGLFDWENADSQSPAILTECNSASLDQDWTYTAVVE